MYCSCLFTIVLHSISYTLYNVDDVTVCWFALAQASLSVEAVDSNFHLVNTIWLCIDWPDCVNADGSFVMHINLIPITSVVTTAYILVKVSITWNVSSRANATVYVIEVLKILKTRNWQYLMRNWLQVEAEVKMYEEGETMTHSEIIFSKGLYVCFSIKNNYRIVSPSL